MVMVMVTVMVMVIGWSSDVVNKQSRHIFIE